MSNVFLDSSIIISYCKSLTGGSALIMQWCDQKKIKAFYSHKVIQEVMKNITEDHVEVELQRWNYIQDNNVLTLIDTASIQEISVAKKIIKLKDAEILATAKSYSVITHLITLDIRDFKTQNVIQYAKPMHIVTPKEFIEEHSQLRTSN